MSYGPKKANLFLIELVCNLLIFALCAAVCVGLLVHARRISQESTRLTQAVYLAQSIAEEWKATGEEPAQRREEDNGFSAQCVGTSWISPSIKTISRFMSWKG